MRATTTKSVSRIWGDYYATHFPEDSKEGVRMMSKRYLRRNNKKMKKMMLRGRSKLERNMFQGPHHQQGLEIHHQMLVKK